MRALRSSATAGAILLSLSYALALFNRTAGTVLAVVLAASYQLDLAEVSSISVVFLWVYALLQLPAGILADMLGPRRLAVVGGIVTGVGSLGFAAAGSIEMAVYARGVTAAGCAVVFVSLMRHIRANWTERRVATVSGRGILIGNLGAIASAAPLSFVLGYIDWRTLWAVIGCTSFAGAGILWYCMADAREPRHPRQRSHAIVQELRAVVSNPYNQIGLLLLAGLSGSYYALASLWAMPMLSARGVSPTMAAIQTSALIAGYAGGACVLGWIGDRSSRRGTLATACAAGALCWTLLAAGASLGSAAYGTVLFLLGFCSGGFNLVYALVTERNPLEHAGTVTAYVNVGIFVGAGVIQSISANLYVAAHGDFTKVLVPMVLGSMMALLLSLSLMYQPGPASAQQQKT